MQQARLDVPESLPLLAALLSSDLPEARYPALQLTPQQQRQRTLETLVALVVGRAERQPVLFLVEDLHWSDPTTLEWLGLVMAQGPTAPLFTLLTCRPTFASPWSGRTHVTLLSVPRLASQQVDADGPVARRGPYCQRRSASTSCARPMASPCLSKRSPSLCWPHSGYRATPDRQASAQRGTGDRRFQRRCGIP